MNLVILSGNICKDNELKQTTSNISVLQNTLAVKNDYKNAKGEYESQFINYVAYKNNAEFLNKYTAKGNRVVLRGRWNTRNYENKEGKKVYVNEMVVDAVEILSFKKQETKEAPKKEEYDPFQDFADEKPLEDEELPF